MGVNRPFRRTVRPFIDGKYRTNGEYIRHYKYAIDPAHYVRALNLIQKDLRALFDFIEPSDINLDCYSFRTHEILLRTCIELEANFKAILFENGYQRSGYWSMDDYKKVERSHLLSLYSVQIPLWREGARVLKPFENWIERGKPEWYQAYNSAKHDRHASFPKANFENLLEAVGGLVILISAQFRNEDFSNRNSFMIIGSMPDGFEDATGGLFRIKYPSNIPQGDRYEFSWDQLQHDGDPFENFPF